MFTNNPKGAFSKIPIKDFSYEQTKYGYTVSIWLKNSGEQKFSSDPQVGRDEYALFSIKDAFSIWFDSALSLRVYIHASRDYNEFSSQESLVVPLHEWVNVQVTVSAEKGITAMTFN